jgi:hypothetical protein
VRSTLKEILNKANRKKTKEASKKRRLLPKLVHSIRCESLNASSSSDNEEEKENRERKIIKINKSLNSSRNK